MKNHHMTSRNGLVGRPWIAAGAVQLAALMLATAWLAPRPAEAASPYWNPPNNVTGEWQNATYWSAGVVASNSDTVGIGMKSYNYTVNVGSDSQVNNLRRLTLAEGGATTVLNQRDGITLGAYSGVYIGYNGVGIYNLNNGTLLVGDNSSQPMSLAAGNNTRGYLNMGDLTGGGTVGAHSYYTPPVYVRQVVTNTTVGEIRGWGTFTVTNNTFSNNGRVIADGWGAAADRTLDLKLTGSASLGGGDSRVQADGTTPGWYATRRGKLTLSSFSVGTGSSTNMWGEPSSDTTPDMVNSIRLAFSNVTGGSLGISLLATDHSAVPLGQFAFSQVTNGFLSVYDFNGAGFTFGSGAVNLTLRYDDALAATNGIAESDLKLYHFNGLTWDTVASSVDTGANTLSADGITGFSYFAVGYAIPEPTTMAFLALAGLGLAFARRKRG